MIIVEESNLFLVKENDITLYVAKSYDEAMGYIEWKNRNGAGNTPEQCAGEP